MRQPVIKLDAAPRHPRMVLAAHFQRGILGKHLARLSSFFSPQNTAPAMISACARVRLSASPRLTSN